MEDYNSSYGQVEVETSGLIFKSARMISSYFGKSFNLVDLGCGDGHNSMSYFKAAFDGLLIKPQQLLVTTDFIDLNANNFNQVRELLNNEQTTFKDHELFYKKGASLVICMNAKSFYSQCLPPNYLHLAFSSVSLQWMETKRSLSNSIVTKSQFITKEEKVQLTKDAESELIQFLKSRAVEMKIGGHLIITIPKDSNKLTIIDILWKHYLNKCGYQHSHFSQVFLPIYPRSNYEIYIALDRVKSQWYPILNSTHIDKNTIFSPTVLRTETFDFFSKGVLASHLFTTENLAINFVEGFFQFVGSDWYHITQETHMIVLERIFES